MADLWIAAQRSRPAARHVGQRKIEDSIFVERRCVGVPAFNAVAVSGQTRLQLLRTAAALDSQATMRAIGLRSARISVLPPGAAQVSRILFTFCVASFAGAGRNLRHQLRAFVLKANAALAKRSGRRHISGDQLCARSSAIRRVRVGCRP